MLGHRLCPVAGEDACAGDGVAGKGHCRARPKPVGRVDLPAHPQKLLDLVHLDARVPMRGVLGMSQHRRHLVETEGAVVAKAPHRIADAIPEERLVEAVRPREEGRVARVLENLPGADRVRDRGGAVHSGSPRGAEVVGKQVVAPVGQGALPCEDVAVGVVGVVRGRRPRADEDLEDGAAGRRRGRTRLSSRGHSCTLRVCTVARYACARLHATACARLHATRVHGCTLRVCTVARYACARLHATACAWLHAMLHAQHNACKCGVKLEHASSRAPAGASPPHSYRCMPRKLLTAVWVCG
eukprot:4060988-Prymnesium_polylepis.2